MKTPILRSFRRAFTLVEMMAAVAVLALLLALILSMVDSASKVADTAFRGGDTSEEATQILDRIGADVAGMIIRPDVDQYYLTSAVGGADVGPSIILGHYNANENSTLTWSGSDEMFFYSQTPGYFGGNGGSAVTATEQTPASLIGYRISTSANATLPPVLQRIVQGMTWDSQAGGGSTPSSLPFLVFGNPATTANPSTMPVATGGRIGDVWGASASPSVLNDLDSNPDTSTSYWHTVGPQVFRISICFQLRNGSFTMTPPSTANPPLLSTTTTPPIAPVAGSINDTTGIVVAIALLDTKSRQIVPTASWAQLINAFADPDQTKDLNANPPVLMSTKWNQVLQQTGFAQSVNIPQTAAAQIVVYQRYYTLNAPVAK